jgi:dihydropyrimidinase
VLAETCPHYLFMTADVLDQPQGAKWMCSPPQRGPADQQALWQGLREGVLDLVSSDHAPYRHDETGKLRAGRDAPFPEIANGMPGLETRLPLMFDAMMSGEAPDPEGFARLTATAAAQIYGLPRKGRIAEGFDADLVIWDPARHVTYGADDLHDNVGYNPWEGRTVTGWPETVLLRGQVVAHQGECLAAPGTGRWLARDGEETQA